MILYHGTPIGNVQEILRGGLRPDGGVVYLARTPRVAFEQAYDAAWERGEAGAPELVVLQISGLTYKDLICDEEGFELDEDIAVRRHISPRQITAMKED